MKLTINKKGYKFDLICNSLNHFNNSELLDLYEDIKEVEKEIINLKEEVGKIKI